VAASLLECVGLPELVTRSLEEYEASTLALACDPSRLAGLRARLAQTRLTSALYDTEGFRKPLEAAYLHMMEISRQGRAPESFTVPG
jgi:predicted O-linked N-acetylglucosamine transferase (SPINDLY family)